MTSSSEQSSPSGNGSVIRKLIRGGGFAFLGKAITYPLGLILTMIFARLLSTADVGGYFLAMSMIMLASGLVQAGLATTMNKMIARSIAHDNPRAARQAIRIGVTALIIAGTIAVVLLVNDPGQWLISRLEDGDRLLEGLVWIAAMVAIFAGINYCCEMLRGFHELPSAALLDQQLLQRLLLFIALLIPLTIGAQLQLRQVLLLTAAAALLALLTGFFLVRRQVMRLGDYGEKMATTQVLSEAPTFLLMRINNWILNSAAVWILGVARPLEEAALYGAGNAVALLVLASWQVISSAVGPTVVTLHAKGDRPALESVLRSAAAVAALPGLALAAILFVFGEPIMSILFTPEYAGAFGVLAILSMGRAVSTLFGTPMMLLSMTHHQDIVLRLLAVASVLTLAAYAWVAEPYGAIGIAAVSAISVVLQGLMLAVIAQRLLGINTLPQLSVSGWRQFFRHLTGS